MLLNPLVVISVLVLLITAGWFMYTGRIGSFAQARPGANLLPALFPAVAGPAATPGPSPSAGSWPRPAAGPPATAVTPRLPSNWCPARWVPRH
ncbi:hypothetical protein NG819_08755 [Pseudarthrobacter sp. Fe7]|nr:hypothetical protein NG819_08755 [Pseudarthrobacter sp. Fe7]